MQPEHEAGRTLLSTTEEHSALANERVVTLGERSDEPVGVGELGSLDDASPLLLRRLSLEARTDQTVLDVAGDGRREQYRFLRNETDLVAEVANVPILDRDAVDLDLATDRVVEPLEETDDGRLAGSGAADERRHLAGREDAVEVVQDLDARATRVDEVDVLELDQALDVFRLETSFRLGVDDGDTVDRGIDLGGSTTRERDRLQVRRELRKREGTDEDREEDVDDLARGDATLQKQGRAVVERETVGAVNDEEENAEAETVEASRLETNVEAEQRETVSDSPRNIGSRRDNSRALVRLVVHGRKALLVTECVRTPNRGDNLFGESRSVRRLLELLLLVLGDELVHDSSSNGDTRDDSRADEGETPVADDLHRAA